MAAILSSISVGTKYWLVWSATLNPTDAHWTRSEITSGLRHMRLLVLLLLACLSGTLQAAAESQLTLGVTESTAAESLGIANEVKARLANKLGVPVNQLQDETDLVKNLNLDQAVVYYAVQGVLDSFGGARQEKELTLIADIVRAAQEANAAARVPAGKPSMMTTSKPSVMTERHRYGAEKSYIRIVYYVTDRKPTGDSAPESFFGPERSENGQLRFGSAEVNIPDSHKPGLIERPWTSNEASSHIFILKLNEASAERFFGEVAAQGDEDVLVFVPGFNVPFEDAILRAAQIAVDFEFKGAPIVFSWPSAGGWTNYNSDWENVNWSAKHIALFLETLADKVKGRIHLVAHSMGSKGLLNALRMLASRGKTGPMFGTVILCAPDFDAGLFSEQIAAEIRPLGTQWVVYTSRKDGALMVSEQVNTIRLGNSITYAEGYEIIDASELQVTPWNVPETHSYYATKKVVLDDMVSALKGVVAGARRLTAKVIDGGTVWILK